MKKIISYLIFGHIAFSCLGWGMVFVNVEAGTPATPTSGCSFTGATEVKDLLKKCKPTGVITTDSMADKDFKLRWGARQRVVEIANQIILAGSILAVGAIVYAAILYIIAAGDDERIKTAKNSLKFGIIGFVMMLLSFPLVNAIIRLFYSISS